MHNQLSILIAALLCMLLCAGCKSNPANPGSTQQPECELGTQALKVCSPNGGEVFQVGDTLYIEWNADLNAINDAALYFSNNGGLDWIDLNSASIEPGNRIWGRFPWVIPSSINVYEQNRPVASNQCLIRINDYDMQFEDLSDAAFEIK